MPQRVRVARETAPTVLAVERRLRLRLIFLHLLFLLHLQSRLPIFLARGCLPCPLPSVIKALGLSQSRLRCRSVRCLYSMTFSSNHASFVALNLSVPVSFLSDVDVAALSSLVIFNTSSVSISGTKSVFSRNVHSLKYQ